MYTEKENLAIKVCDSANNTTKKLYKKSFEYLSGWKGNYLKIRPTVEDLEDFLSDNFLMLSIYQEVKNINSHILTLDIEEGKLNLLPYVFYDKIKTDSGFIKRFIEKEKKEIEIKSNYEIEKVRNAFDLDFPWQEETDKLFNKFNSNPENQHPKEPILNKAVASDMLNNFSEQRLEDIQIIKSNIEKSLQQKNKELYAAIGQSVNQRQSLPDEPIHKDGLAIFKGLLKWLIAPMPEKYTLMTCLYELDKDLLSELSDTDVGTVRDDKIQELNSLRNEGAEISLKIELLEFVMDCKENGRSPELKNLHYLYNDSCKKNKNDSKVDPEKRIPESKFYDIIDNFSQPKTKRGINSVLVKKLYNEKHKVGGEIRKLVCYKAKDIEKKHPLPLTKSTARRRIVDYL